METRYRFGAVPKTALILTLLAMLLALFSAIAVGQQPSPKLPPPLGLARSGLIAFDDGGDIFVVDPDGTARKALTSGPELDTSPEWSQDGTQIAYVSQQTATGPAAIKVMQADGTHIRTLVEGVTQSPAGFRMSWSHDGRLLAYSDTAGQPGREVNRIMVIDVAGGDPQEVVSPGQAPTWSPDDQLIGYRSGGRTKDLTDEPIGLSVIGADGTGQLIIDSRPTPNPWAYAFPQWSSDGTRLTYHTRVAPAVNEVYVAAVDGSGITAVGDLAQDRVWPVWSPDGTRIAYSGPSTREGMYQLGVMDADGTDIETLIHPPLGCNCAFRWSPDGTQLVAWLDGPVVGGSPTSESLMVAGAAGTAPVETIELSTLIGTDMSWQRLAP